MKREFGLPALLVLRHQQYVTVGEGGLEFDEIQTVSVLLRQTALSVTHNKETVCNKAVTAVGSKILKDGSLQK